MEKKYPYEKECLKFIELSYRIFLEYFGHVSPYFAEFLLSAAKVCHNIQEFGQSDAYIQEALKFFKSSSKHTRNTLACSIIAAKSRVENGILAKDSKIFNEGVDGLEKLVEDLSILGFNT